MKRSTTPPAELRALRRALGLTQEQMARKLGLSTRALGRYERGQRRITIILMIAARCLAYHQGRA